jgi:pantoate--beta-alanine ligase
MKVVRSVSEMINLSYTFRSAGKTIALVPTMGALHAGHLSLLKRARECADTTVMSLFVNPTQFGAGEDFDKYPRTFENDRMQTEMNGCDILFAPDESQMYPSDHRTTVAVSDITEKLCGKSRPTHFTGVTTIVLKLLNIIHPHYAVFGAKDAQQVIVIRRMLKDLHHSTRIEVGPIIREPDGLALSSRNAYLTGEERTEAPNICIALKIVRNLFEKGETSAESLKSVLNEHLMKFHCINVEYAEIVDCTTLEPLKAVTGKALVAVACKMKESRTRLIDNTILGGAL